MIGDAVDTQIISASFSALIACFYLAALLATIWTFISLYKTAHKVERADDPTAFEEVENVCLRRGKRSRRVIRRPVGTANA